MKLSLGLRMAILAALVLVGLAPAEPANADHSIGRPCIDCHSLRSTNVVPGSRNVKQTEVTDPLYNGEWYNAAGWASSAANWPLDCSYCHSEDIGFEIKNAYGGKRGLTSPGRTRTAIGSAHPVDVRGDEVYYSANLRITCNDCHNGPPGNPKITPAGLLSKSDTDGYPNHIDAVISPTAPPGENDLTNNPPQLTAPYGPGAVWGKATPYVTGDLLCFTCHDGDKGTLPPFSTGLREDTYNMTNIMGEYSMTGGGHNVQGIGKGIGSGGVNELKRMACYNCHDPHSGVYEGRANKALITPTPIGAYTNAGGTVDYVNPFDPGSNFTFTDYDPAVSGDRALCLTCHTSNGSTIEGANPIQFMNPISSGNLVYGFHTNAHATVESSGNCLQANGGCHQSPHNTSPYDCLGCHNSNLPNYASFPAALKAVAHVNSDFGYFDSNGAVGAAGYNGIKSRHEINYDRTSDLSSPLWNGCLACHNVPGGISANLGKKLAVGNTVYDSLNVQSLSDRETLNTYDAFCLDCHKGITSSDPVRQLSGYYPPQVNNQYDYFYNGGHGTGKGGETFPSGNSQAKVGCVECHLYHGSTAHKLLPGDDQTADGTADPTTKGGKVVKGFPDYNAPTLGTKLTIGGVSNSKKIDYTDYTMKTNGNNRLPDDKKRSFKYANYSISSSWNTYYEDVANPSSPPDPPGATRISFGTTGDKIVDGGTPVTSASDHKVGFCNTCHLYKNTSNGTNQTAEWVSTHEGATGFSTGFPSKRLFFKDCSECHDPHGSGDKSSDTPNAYMVRGKIITDNSTNADGSDPKVFNVVFKGKSGIDSGDEYYSSGTTVDDDKRDNLCAVCHTQPDHNIRVKPPDPVKNHNASGDCFLCHPHGDKNTYVFPGFPGVPVGGCDGCHGYPPQRTGTAGSQAPPEENYNGGGGPHIEHVNLLAAANNLLPAQYKDNYSNNTRILCGPCHGEDAPQHTSGNSNGLWSDNSVRTHVNIGQRAPGTTSWGSSPSYDGRLLPAVTGQTVMAATAPNPMSMANSVCANVDCHLAPTVASELAWYSTTTEGGDSSDTASTFNPQDSPKRTRICFDCHDATPPDIRVYDYAGTQVFGKLRASALPYMYDPKKINVAANYFGTLSDFGRGGHGDYRLSQAGFDVNSAVYNITASNPIDCTACHNWTSQHFSLGATPKSFRLRNPVLETSGHGNTGLCNQTSCHPGANYPGTGATKLDYKHHPSYLPAPSASSNKTITKDVTGSTTWTKTGQTWSQNGYAPGDTTLFGSSQLKDVDYFTDWYSRGSNWDPAGAGGERHDLQEPMGSLLSVTGNLTSYTPGPMATLPLAKDITGTGADSGYFLCVTCHNPHGTDLYVHLGSASPSQLIKDNVDNNMLRLRPEDNRLCIACH